MWPRWKGLPVDYCADWNEGCGQDAALEFCKLNSFSYVEVGSAGIPAPLFDG